MRGVIRLSVPITKTARTLQASGMFDVPAAEKSEVEIPYDLPIDGEETGEGVGREWNVGLIVGPSGSGKSSIVRECFGAQFANGWEPGLSVIDGFPRGMAVKDILDLCSSVGFSSPPSWLRTYDVLSTGEKFRVDVARSLADALTNPALSEVVIDEFTSVVDRTVAQIGSSAIARTVRKHNMKFVAATCHYDVLEWLQPDWVFDTKTSQFDWRSVQPRPSIELRVQRVHHSFWQVFSRHHYLSADLNPSAVCFAAFLPDGQPVAFNAWLSQPHRSIPNLRRSSRVVTLPDYQGIGIGNTLVETAASMWAALNYRAMATAAHPAMVAHRARSPKWFMHRDASRNTGGGMMNREAGMRKTIAIARLTAGFEYVGPHMDKGVAEALYNTQV